MYQHTRIDGSVIDLPVGKAVCVGRNYAAHARELGNAVPDAPILFLKPRTAIVPLSPSFAIPAGRGSCHHETEIAVLIGHTAKGLTVEAVPGVIAGYGLALDLTLRDLQNELKKQGYPWEVAKAFDGACPLSPFLSPEAFGAVETAGLALSVNGAPRQNGLTRDMMTGIYELVAYISHIFTLEPGDVVLTGTPEGVAALASGDVLELTLLNRGQPLAVFSTRVA
ncbi:2-keto-4-pentenoate hydratase/2-oxohepta-3-ene-1,7-dioic acid hydratase in catechol pathway [Fluviicoccus keumensis]|uniref:2-keto-4-pentenoate hydratase/2-oxohepta-3-ene-1,7-dioic acid hydratase in catechol pathway n=1 Tax=Fluviicoccus keumensis TaxID=1435465 RepID=A0A4Q7ZAN2_9GAMM|nr:fumarylacetoacetate hydrolase family protein [Fluviicoccus keumensis]RZU47618.1 2-keto-4-pentenoate hydratase/2-oxohepta-3-ene-1,7-dioic acid hydratase in catechol pathway [Fluviicoccus keumensis]